MFKGLSILDSCSSHSSSCGVYGEVVLSSIGTPCASLPISPGPVEFLLACSPACSLTLKISNGFVTFFRERERGTTGTGRDETRAELKKAGDIRREISAVFRGSCSHFLLHNPLQCSTGRTRRQEPNVKEVQCQLMPLFFVNGLFYGASGRGASPTR